MAIDSIMNPATGAGALGNVTKIGSGAGAETITGPSFGDVLKQSTEAAIDTMRAGEKASAQAVTGKADLNDVVQAVTSAELTLQTVVAIRDRLVNALQEVIRMPV
jgi:flagellar hook-basal body complex protein FliE